MAIEDGLSVAFSKEILIYYIFQYNKSLACDKNCKIIIIKIIKDINQIVSFIIISCINCNFRLPPQSKTLEKIFKNLK